MRLFWHKSLNSPLAQNTNPDPNERLLYCYPDSLFLNILHCFWRASVSCFLNFAIFFDYEWGRGGGGGGAPARGMLHLSPLLAGFFEEFQSAESVHSFSAAYIILMGDSSFKLGSFGFFRRGNLPNWTLRLVVVLVGSGISLALIRACGFMNLRAPWNSRHQPPGSHRRRI